MRLRRLADFLIGRFPLIQSRSLWVKGSASGAVLAVLFLVFGTAFWDTFRDWLIASESGSTTIRNLGLVAAGLIALPLALWRGHVAEQQADAAQRSLRNERYQKGAEMLGSEVLSVRLGGIYALERLVKEYSEEYHVQIMGIFSAFARHPTVDAVHEEEIESRSGIPYVRDDMQAVVQAIGKRGEEEVSLERMHNFQLDLRNSHLEFADLEGVNLSQAQLEETILSHGRLKEANLSGSFAIYANFHRAELVEANLSGSMLISANLSRAVLYGAKLTGAWLGNANLIGANLSGADLSRVHGLTQNQLNQGRADPQNIPTLDGSLDVETKSPLIWGGGTLEEDT